MHTDSTLSETMRNFEFLRHNEKETDLIKFP